jgi:hypothetical protein
VGKPNERERDLLFSVRKVHISSKTTFPAKENTSQHQICPTEICLVFRAKTIPLSSLFRTSFSVLIVRCTDCSVWPKNSHRKSEKHLENRAKNHPYFRAKTVRQYGLYGSVQYGLPQQKNISAKNSKNFFLGNRAFFPRKTCPLCCSLSSLKLTLKISLTLFPISSQTFDMPCTLPNAFFYNLKMTFSPQKCLFTFPNPRSKGQD